MIRKAISIKIDKAIKEIRMKNISKDFREGYIINEDCLKMALCYHLRRKLSAILRENDLRIFTEKYFPSIKKKPDIIIAQIRDEYGENLKKLKNYVQKSKFQCLLYFAVIYEVECYWLHWLDKRSTNNWASGRVTELDGGWIDGIMNYEIHSY